MFANRLRKNLQRLDPWAEREHIDCFRVYDADMPEYAFAIDLYGRGAPARLCPGICSAQNGQSGKCPGAPPRGIGGACRRCWQCRLLRSIPGCASRRRAASSTRSATRRAERYAVQEGGLKFWVNFRDYLDTGLFLDHRLVRGMLREWAQGARFPEFILLHRQRHGLCGGGRSAQHRQRRSIEYLFGLGARESPAQRLSRFRARAISRGLPAMARGAGTPGSALRFDLRGSADLLQFQAHGRRAGRPARSCRG